MRTMAGAQWKAIHDEREERNPQSQTQKPDHGEREGEIRQEQTQETSRALEEIGEWPTCENDDLSPPEVEGIQGDHAHIALQEFEAFAQTDAVPMPLPL